MSTAFLTSSVHVCEDTNTNFDIATLLASAGYAAGGGLAITSFQVKLPNGTTTRVDSALFGKVDADTVYVHPSGWAQNFNGSFSTVEVVLDSGNGNTVSLSLQVIIDPVNDAPSGADKTFNLADGNAVVLSQADFGFVDAVEHNGFASVVLSSLPPAGQVLRNGVALAVGAEFTVAELAAGAIVFQPSSTTSGSFEVGFQLRDDGGMVGCGAADLSITPNYLHFNVPMSHLGNFVWEDSNGNGVQDAGEAGVANVAVALLDASGNTLASTTTDASGLYTFTVTAGTYAIALTPPAGFVATVRDAGGDDATDSDIGSGLVSANITVLPGATDNTLDAGLVRLAELGDHVWSDTNKNGVQDAGEAGVAGVLVRLLDASGTPTGATASTDADGNYLFSNLKPGTYSVQFDKTTLPAGYVLTSANAGASDAIDSDASITDGSTASVTLGSGGSNQSLDAGIVALPATLGDTVWEDRNANGVQDADEGGLAGVTVNLKDAGGAILSTTTTDGSGKYTFSVDPGTYSVSLVAPAGYVVTDRDAGSDDGADSDVDASGNSGVVTLAAAEINNSVDAGLYRTASLGDRVWLDTNKNGVQDSGEPGAAGVKVILLDAAGNPAGATATTDSSGNYQFSNLKPGVYSVQFDQATLPANHVFTGADQGGTDGLDSDANAQTGVSAPVTLASGEHNTSVDAGIVALPATLGDTVWEDGNANGVQDAGEAGLAGVTVNLKGADGSILNTTTTDGSGNYTFSVDPGTYSVSVVAPAGYVVTGKDVGANDAIDSDIDASGNSAGVTLTAGQVNNSVDAGLYRKASLGDRVWLDSNKNGVQDSGEAGVAGVKVILLDAAGNPAGATATTDSSGNYQFSNLKPGVYSVQFDKTTLPANYIFTGADQGSDDALDSDANVSTGKTASVTLASGDANSSLDAGIVALPATIGDLVWDDKNANGVQDTGEAGIANVVVQLRNGSGVLVSSTTTDASGKYGFSVDPGTYSVAVVAPSGFVATGKDAGTNDAIDSDIGAGLATGNFTVAAGEINKTIDAGLYALAQVGDRVWVDCNKNGLQDSAENGVSGVRVTLLDAAGNAVGSPLITDANGNYLFKELKPGNYSVQFDKATLPAGTTFTARDVGSNDALDSDVDAAGKTGSFTLSSGQVNKTVDAGLLQAAQIGDRVWIDKNANGVQDSGESGLANATVQLKDSAGTVLRTVNTDAEGYYKFDVAPGTYSVHVNTPSGYLITGRNVGSDDGKDSDIGSTGNTSTVTVAAGDVNKTLDAGFYKTASVGDHVWLDTNGNGVQDSGEAGVAGVTVKLFNAGGSTAISSAATNSAGDYTFSNLTPGNYVVQFVAPSGYAFTGKDVGSNNGVDSDASASSGKTAQFTLSSGQADVSWDAGLVKYGSIGNLVWEDKNYNGIQDAGEAGVKDVVVKLLNGSNVVLASTTTDASGNYLFSNLKAGDYKVQVDKPAAYYYTKADVGSNGALDSDVGATGRTTTISLAPGQNDLNWDAGIYRKASVGDLVWRDRDHDGIQDSGEEGIGGITVQLFTETGVLVDTRKTDANGKYKFVDVDPGSYYLKFDKTNVSFTDASRDTYNMSSWKWGLKNVGSNDAVDSDVTGNGIDLTNVTRTDVFKLTSGLNDMSRDATITPLVIDLNGDGIHTIARADFSGQFDLLGNGTSIHSGWISGDDGFLAIDLNGNGKIDGIGELFGGQNTGDGFARLAVFDSNGDGQVNAGDAQFAALSIWRDANSNGITDAGELVSLHEAGVASLTVSYVSLPFLDANHNLHLERSSATLSSGAAVDMTDIYLNVDAEEAAAAGAVLSSVADLVGDDTAGTQLIGCAPLLGAL